MITETMVAIPQRNYARDYGSIIHEMQDRYGPEVELTPTSIEIYASLIDYRVAKRRFENYETYAARVKKTSLGKGTIVELLI